MYRAKAPSARGILVPEVQAVGDALYQPQNLRQRALGVLAVA